MPPSPGTALPTPPGSAAGWEAVEHGMSGTAVYRSTDEAVHAKCVAADRINQLAEERDKIVWLATTPITGPSVIDWQESAGGAVLVMTTVRGLPACDLARAMVPRAVESMAGQLRRLHELPLADCPFVRRLDVTVSEAAQAVQRKSVDVTEFDYIRLGRTPDDLLSELVDGEPKATDLEARDLVVCHGDPCLPNFLIDSETGECAGLVDLGRLGVADRYLDLAIVTRSTAAQKMNEQYSASDAATFLARYGVPTPDPWRLEYYRLLDEFS